MAFYGIAKVCGHFLPRLNARVYHDDTDDGALPFHAAFRGRAAGWIMSKKQVLLLSIMLAIPVIGLLVVLTLNGLNHGGNMFSGLMVVVVVLTGILCLALGLSPFAVMAFYPAEGFASLAPPAPADPTKPAGGSDTDDEDDGFGEDEFDDDDTMLGDDSADDEFGGEDYGDDDELFDDGDEFEDEDENW